MLMGWPAHKVVAWCGASDCIVAAQQMVEAKHYFSYIESGNIAHCSLYIGLACFVWGLAFLLAFEWCPTAPKMLGYDVVVHTVPSFLHRLALIRAKFFITILSGCFQRVPGCFPEANCQGSNCLSYMKVARKGLKGSAWNRPLTFIIEYLLLFIGRPGHIVQLGIRCTKCLKFAIKYVELPCEQCEQVFQKACWRFSLLGGVHGQAGLRLKDADVTW